VASLLERHATDPVTLDAALSSVRGGEAAVLEALMRPGAETTTARDAALTMLAATIVRGAGDAAVQALFTRIADQGRPAWQRSALLRGAEVALMGAPMPGARERRAEAAPAAPLPCPTCPGGRAGPGGAYAFPRPENWASIVGGGRGDQKLRLAREPRALTAMPAGDELGKRATALAERVTWPGKPGEAAPVAALTAAEQARFDMGREIYGNVCQSCHQPDGRGQEKLVPPLRGSVLALAPAEIPVRILLHGKEGTIGLMPPIGSTFTDEQVASVLTYIRREWGHAATPVEAAAVKDVRARTADRTRPWTDAELKALAEQVR
jgi:mono/diheme cytochrome c family protein